jgi:hypothetical protein
MDVSLRMKWKREEQGWRELSGNLGILSKNNPVIVVMWLFT